MKTEVVKHIISFLEENLDSQQRDDFIGKLFEQRAEELHMLIMNNKEYKQYANEISKLDEEIHNKFENSWEILNLIEKHENIAFKSSYICEKLMYKHGLLDGIQLILDGTKTIDITKSLIENK